MMKYPSAALVRAALASPLWLLRAQAPEAESRSVWDGVYTEEQAKRGEPIYHKECAACHGAMLTGGESAPPLTGGPFLANWNGLTMGDFFDRIRKTMPQTNPGRRTRQQDAAILPFFLTVNKFPPRQTALSRQPKIIKRV